jgi:hypothetical protein
LFSTHEGTQVYEAGLEHQGNQAVLALRIESRPETYIHHIEAGSVYVTFLDTLYYIELHYYRVFY